MIGAGTLILSGAVRLMASSVASSVARGIAVAGATLTGALAQPAAAQRVPVPVPFETGEVLVYDVKFGSIKVGNGGMRVVGIDTIRGQPAWHVRFSISGGTFFYKVNDVYQSWMDIYTLNSLRYIQDTDQGSREVKRRYEIFPDLAMYNEVAKNNREMPSVYEPLDDGSFMFFIRTVDLQVGQTYEFNRYFKPDRNPVIIRVLRKERVKVPAGTFNAIVIQPIIKTSGIFGEGGQAEIWLSDDDKRMMLQLKSRLVFGSLNLYLRSYRLSAPPDTTGREGASATGARAPGAPAPGAPAAGPTGAQP
ncbi:MAG TPA: DUF3108 domain-containing protein [Gemmatimonadaceae bacterium]|nr:DUF3108 domain-containing protein [Gemmatimonadaceae bacterium]